MTLIAETPLDVLAAISAATHGSLHPTPIGRCSNGDMRTRWVGLDEVLAEPSRLATLVEAAGQRRFRSDDTGLVLAQVARESISALATAAAGLWGQQRRLLDLTAANVALAEGEWVVVGLRRPRLAVLPDDPMRNRPDVEVLDEAAMFERLLALGFGSAVPRGELPPGAPHEVAALAGLIAAVRRLVCCGDRHLWGSAALGASTALTHVSHTLGKSAELDRCRLLEARPDLARTLNLITIDDRVDDEITFALRKTCCLLMKLPIEEQCGTCSLRDEAECLGLLTDWYVQERRRLRQELSR